MLRFHARLPLLPVIERPPHSVRLPLPGPDLPGLREPWRQRRRLFASGRGLVCSILAAALLDRPAQAHHGFAGKYDFTRPFYLAGRLTDAYVGYPHARLTLDVPRDLQLPRDREWMRALEDAEARQTTTLLRAADRRGVVDVTLDRRLTRRLMDEREALAPGDPVEAVVYRRTTRDEYRNELQVALIALPDGRVLVSSSPSVKSP